jgi:hypothetical protein
MGSRFKLGYRDLCNLTRTGRVETPVGIHNSPCRGGLVRAKGGYHLMASWCS